jgi:Na+/phosphate symporter
MEREIIYNTDNVDTKTGQEKNKLELLDRGVDILKAVLTNNSVVVKAVCDAVRDVSKTVENSINGRLQKEISISEQRMKVVSDTRDAVLQELNREDLAQEERQKLLNILDKATPNEEAIHAITRGTSVAKTALCTLGVVAAAVLVLRRKK